MNSVNWINLSPLKIKAKIESLSADCLFQFYRPYQCIGFKRFHNWLQTFHRSFKVGHCTIIRAEQPGRANV